MAININKVFVLGRVGQDPEMRDSSTGMKIARFTVATTRRRKNAEDETEWHSISAFGKTAEFIGNYVRKGTEVYIEGSLRTRKYTAQDGSERKATEILCDRVQLGARPRTEEQAPVTRTASDYEADDIPF